MKGECGREVGHLNFKLKIDFCQCCFRFCSAFCSLSLFDLLHEFFAIELAKLAVGQIEERFEWQMDEDEEATEQRMGKVRNIGIWSCLVISAPGWMS